MQNQQTLTICSTVAAVIRKLRESKSDEELKKNPYVRLLVEPESGGGIHLYFRIALPVILPSDAVIDMEGTKVLCNLECYDWLCGCELDYDGRTLKHRIAA